ncbi:MAG TPA: diguanylate cyclase [Acidimicrobiales bacterium]|nr:diguanylate cyclase [Acidimicrobiales bacterium]
MTDAAAPVVTPYGADGPARAVSRLGTLEDLLRDDLTQLGSLLTLRGDLELLLDAYQPFGARPALLLVDIDDFARINTSFGRAAGDTVLVETATRLSSRLPSAHVAYRTGGDEFAALLDTTPMIDAVAEAGQLQQALSQPVEVERSIVPVTVSVAVVMLGYRHRVDALLRDADVAMYRAKVEGGNRVDLYNWEVDSWSTARRRDARHLEEEVEELRQQNRLLAEALTVDLDTGLPNALAFEADHLQADAWRRRSGEPYAVLRVSVEGLYEHMAHFRSPAGQAALSAVAHSIRDTVRQSDRAYVLERGEFAVLLRGSPVHQALGAARRVRAAVDRLELGHPTGGGVRLAVTVAAIEAGYRHPGPADVMTELEGLLQGALGGGGSGIVWPL